MKADDITKANISELVPENAEEFFDHQMAWGMIESNMEELLMEWFDCPDEDDYYFFEGDFRFDWYDYSFEFTDVDPEWEPTKEQLQKAVDFGFRRCWFNYTDGTELHCYFDKDDGIQIGKRKKRVTK